MLNSPKPIPPLPQLLTILLLTKLSSSMSFPLPTTGQTCIKVPTINIYQFQFISLGQGQQHIYCRIEDSPSNPIQTITNKTHSKTIINFTTNTSRICFSSTDSLKKTISFDLMAINDPMKVHLIDKDLNQIYSHFEELHLNMERLHRNQYFYYEKNREHKRMLMELEFKLKLIKSWKIVILIFCGIFQYCFIKRLIKTKQYNPLSAKNSKSKIIHWQQYTRI